MINSNESIPRIVYGRQQRANPIVETSEQYWRVTISIPLLDSIISELECRFSEDKMVHYELFNLMPQVISANEDLQSTESTIIRVWGDLIPFILWNSNVGNSIVLESHVTSPSLNDLH